MIDDAIIFRSAVRFRPKDSPCEARAACCPIRRLRLLNQSFISSSSSIILKLEPKSLLFPTYNPAYSPSLATLTMFSLISRRSTVLAGRTSASLRALSTSSVVRAERS